MNYLVESHMGGYYISDDYESIATYCETCGDSDSIIISWDGEDEKYNALLSLVLEDYYLSIDTLKEYFYSLLDCYENKTFLEFLDEFKFLRESQKKDKESFIRLLSEECVIDKSITRKLLYNNTKAYNKEMLLLDSCHTNIDKYKSKVKKIGKIKPRFR